MSPIITGEKYTVDHGASTAITESTIPAHEAASAMHLMANLYTDVPWAIIRELVTNGIDSHVRAGGGRGKVIVDLPTEDNPTLTVTDFGTGMSRKTFAEVYGNFSVSTKRGDDTQIGQLGAGAKSPYAMANQFTAVSRHKGVEYHVLLTKTDEGKPGWAIMAENPTDAPDGVTVTVPVPADRVSEFHSAARKNLGYFDEDHFDNCGVTVTCDGQPFVLTSPLHVNREERACHGNTLVRLGQAHPRMVGGFWRQNTAAHYVVMGGVKYDIPDAVIEHLHKATREPLDMYKIDFCTRVPHRGLPAPGNARTRGTAAVFHHIAPLGTFTPAPSREAIADTPANREALATMMSTWLAHMRTEYIEPLHRADYAEYHRMLRQTPRAALVFYANELDDLDSEHKRDNKDKKESMTLWVEDQNRQVDHWADYSYFQFAKEDTLADGTPAVRYIDTSIGDKIVAKVTAWRKRNGMAAVIGVDMARLRDANPDWAKDIEALPLSWLEPEDVLAAARADKPAQNTNAPKAPHRVLARSNQLRLNREHCPDPDRPENITDEGLRQLIAQLEPDSRIIVGTVSQMIEHNIADHDADLLLASTRKNIRAYIDAFGGEDMQVSTPGQYVEDIVAETLRAHDDGKLIFLNTYRHLGQMLGINLYQSNQGKAPRHCEIRVGGIGNIATDFCTNNIRDRITELRDSGNDPETLAAAERFIADWDEFLADIKGEIDRHHSGLIHTLRKIKHPYRAHAYRFDDDVDGDIDEPEFLKKYPLSCELMGTVGKSMALTELVLRT